MKELKVVRKNINQQVQGVKKMLLHRFYNATAFQQRLWQDWIGFDI